MAWRIKITQSCQSCTSSTGDQVHPTLTSFSLLFKFLFQPFNVCCCECTGFEILAFPCNQFAGQEPGTTEQIANFVCTKFKAEYPVFDKVSTDTRLFICWFTSNFPFLTYVEQRVIPLFLIQIHVNGSSASPLYKFLKSSKHGTFGDNIKWNFTKFLVDRDGNVVNRFSPTTAPHKLEVKLSVQY